MVVALALSLDGMIALTMAFGVAPLRATVKFDDEALIV
jgi:hypothetical protein